MNYHIVAVGSPMIYRRGSFNIHKLLKFCRASVNSCCLLIVSRFNVWCIHLFVTWRRRQAQPRSYVGCGGRLNLGIHCNMHCRAVLWVTFHLNLLIRVIQTIWLESILIGSLQCMIRKKCGGRLSIHPQMCLQCKNDMHVKEQSRACAHIIQSMPTANVWFTHMTSSGHSRF